MSKRSDGTDGVEPEDCETIGTCCYCGCVIVPEMGYVHADGDDLACEDCADEYLEPVREDDQDELPEPDWLGCEEEDWLDDPF